MGAGNSALLRCRSRLRRLQRRIDAALRRKREQENARTDTTNEAGPPVVLRIQDPSHSMSAAKASDAASRARFRDVLWNAVGCDGLNARLLVLLLDPMILFRGLDTSGWGDEDYS